MTVYRCPLFINSSNNSAAGSTLFIAVGNGGGNFKAAADEAAAQIKFYTDGWFDKLRVYVSANAGTGGGTATLRINGADTAATLNIGSTLTGLFEDSNTVAFSTNDLVCIKVVNTSNSTITFRTTGCDMLTTTAYNKVLVLASTNLNTASITRYLPPAGFGSYLTTEDDNIQMKVPAAGTVKNLRFYLDTRTGTATGDVTLRVNQVDTALAITTGVIGAYEDVSDTINLSVDDELTFSVIKGAGSGSWRMGTLSYDLECTTAGDMINLAGPASGGAMGNNLTRFAQLLGGDMNGLNATEALQQIKVYGSGTIGKVYHHVTSNSASNDTTYTARKNGADTAITFTVGAAATGPFSDTSNSFSWAAGDLIGMMIVRPAGTGTIVPAWYSCILTLDGESDPGGGGESYDVAISVGITGSVTQAASVGLSSSIVLGISNTIADTAMMSMSPSISLGLVGDVSASANLGITPSVSLGISSGVTDSANIGIVAQLNLGLSSAFSYIETMAMDEAIALTISGSLGISSSSSADVPIFTSIEVVLYGNPNPAVNLYSSTDYAVTLYGSPEISVVITGRVG